MSGSFYTLNSKYNTLLSLFNSFFPYPPSPTPYPPPADVMTLSTAQTATGLKTFSVLPQSSVVPTIGDQLVNKTYADSLVPTPVNAVTIDGSQTLGTGVKTFTNLPTCSAVPSSGSQLVNKTYVDGLTPATPNLSAVLAVGNSAGANSIDMNTNAISAISTATAKTSFVVNNSVAGASTTLTDRLLTINTTGLSNAPVLSLNQSGIGVGILTEECYNQRAPQTGEFNRISFYAKNASNTKTEFVRLHQNAPVTGVGSERGRLDIAVLASGGMSDFVSCNGSTNNVEISKNIDMNSNSILAVQTISDYQSLPFLPQGTIEASSNNPTAITAYGNNHQVLLKAKPVPTIDTLTQQVPYITNATIRCSTVSASYQWVGLENGEVWVYDVGLGNWALYASFSSGFSPAVSALHYDFYYDRLYIGGTFDSAVYPVAVTALNNVCYIQTPTATPAIVTQLAWAGASDPGFNSHCYAITGDTNTGYIYFAGDFTWTYNNSIQLNYFGAYYQVTNTITPANGNSGDGFNGSIWNIDFISGANYICVTGGFNTLTSGGGSNYSPYCLSFGVSGNSIGAISLFDGGAGTLSSPIDNCWDCIDNNGSNFFVALGNNTYSGVNYLAECPYASMVPAVVGAGAFNAKVTSLYYNFSSGYTEVVTASNSQYIQNGNLYATLPWTPWVFRFRETGQTWFNRQATGTQWAFLGSTANTFVLQSGRTIKSGGVTYTGGIASTTPVDGNTLLLNWNGVEYFIVSQIGTGWNPYT